MCIECNFNDWEYTVVINVKCFIVINWWQELYAFMYTVQYMLMQYSYKLWMLHQPTHQKKKVCVVSYSVQDLLQSCCSFFTSKRLIFAISSSILAYCTCPIYQLRKHALMFLWNHVIHTCNFKNVSMFVLLYM